MMRVWSHVRAPPVQRLELHALDVRPAVQPGGARTVGLGVARRAVVAVVADLLTVDVGGQELVAHAAVGGGTLAVAPGDAGLRARWGVVPPRLEYITWNMAAKS